MINTPGRPTVLTPETVSILADCLRQGMSVREACAQSVISHEAYYSRLRSDGGFADKMYVAQQHTSMKAKQLLAAAIDNGDLSTAKWWLERKEPQEFALNRKVAVEIEPYEPQDELSHLTDLELIELAKELHYLEESQNKGEAEIDKTD